MSSDREPPTRHHELTVPFSIILALALSATATFLVTVVFGSLGRRPEDPGELFLVLFAWMFVGGFLLARPLRPLASRVLRWDERRRAQS